MTAISRHGQEKVSLPVNRGWVTAQATKRPKAMPTNVPSAARMTDSARIEVRSCRRDMPTDRRSPISGVRSVTDRIRVFTMPNTAMATAKASSALTDEMMKLKADFTNWAMTLPGCTEMVEYDAVSSSRRVWTLDS